MSEQDKVFADVQNSNKVMKPTNESFEPYVSKQIYESSDDEKREPCGLFRLEVKIILQRRSLVILRKVLRPELFTSKD